MLNWLKNLFKKKPSLREQCVAAYGEKFGEMYDELNSGTPIGDLDFTMHFISMVTAVKQGKPYDVNKLAEPYIPEVDGGEITGVYIPGKGTYEKVNGNLVKTN